MHLSPKCTEIALAKKPVHIAACRLALAGATVRGGKLKGSQRLSASTADVFMLSMNCLARATKHQQVHGLHEELDCNG